MINIVIDIGNTCAKLAAFQEDKMLEVVTTDNRTLEDLPAFVTRYSPSRAILSTVIDLTSQVEASLKMLTCPLLKLCAEVPLPVQILYDTPQTLGSDRIAAVVGAVTAIPHKPLLVIDAGTCITYEYVDAQGRYLGGNISPGVQMRFQAMHHLTGRLPLVSSEGRSLPMGKDTETAMRAGVMQGIKYEIEGYVSNLKAKNPELLVFLTGGSDFSFDSNLKNLIFADKFLVLKGLNRILNYNK